MLVDPDVLRAFADQVAIASNAIRDADAGQRVATSADGLDGSTTQWAARLVGEHIRILATGIAAGVNDMGVAVRGAGDRYEVSDADLSTTFIEIF